VRFLCLEPRETDKNVLNFQKIGSWNFISCSWEPCKCEYPLQPNVTK